MSLQRVLAPRSVAVIGASRVETKRGFQSIRTLVEDRFQGAIYPVNPKEESILGLPCYPSIGEVVGEVDLALITTPARTIPGILEQCADKGVAGAVIIAGGFGEMGAEGKELERQVSEVAFRRGIRIIGPNTSGMINVQAQLNLVGMRDVPRGEIALLSQSGNMALALITEAAVSSQQGFSCYVGVGNEAGIRFHEYLEHFRGDPGTRVIAMYVEGMRDGRSFLRVAHETTPRKPVVMLKSGRSERGRSSAGSHSGALAGSAEVARSALRRAGVVLVEEADKLYPCAEALASLPPMATNRLAILADGGGHATIAADALTDMGVEIPELGAETQERLRQILPLAAAVANPIDVAGATDANPALFADVARILLEDEQVGGLLLVGLFGGYGIRFAGELKAGEEEAAIGMGDLLDALGKPIVVHSLYDFARPRALDLLRERRIPVHGSVEVACRCIGALAEYGRFLREPSEDGDFHLQWRQRADPEGAAIIAGALDGGRDALLEHEAKRLVALHGVPVPRDVLAETADAAAEAAGAVGGPVALKLVSPQVLHKSDAGGVALGLTGEGEVRSAFDEIVRSAREYDPSAEIRGVLVSPMAAPGVEVIVGTKTDDQFGPVILFGIGGVLVEVVKDVAFRVLPLTPESARQMIDDIDAVALLDGFRGRPPADREALVTLLCAVSELIEAYPEISTMDLNPVIVHERGLTVVDARILLRRPESADG